METNIESKAVQSELTKRLAAPAVRALNNVGIETLAQLSKHSESDITKLHGIGSSALKVLKAKLKAKGLSFRQR
jgi:DNA-directed RNA polymerase alpha subunit